MNNFENVCGISDTELSSLENEENLYDGVSFNEYGNHDINIISSVANNNCIYDSEVENEVEYVGGQIREHIETSEGLYFRR